MADTIIQPLEYLRTRLTDALGRPVGDFISFKRKLSANLCEMKKKKKDSHQLVLQCKQTPAFNDDSSVSQMHVYCPM